MYAATSAGGVNIPQRIAIAGAPVEHSESRTYQHFAGKTGLPRHHSRLRGIVEHILRLQPAERRLRAVQRRVAELEQVPVARAHGTVRLDAYEGKTLDIRSAPNVRR